ncbi:hypothetical protein [uncultured Helicobacter sp.]|uniref:hypothetical protein n=1 Tax=uncultured Helicobacter sp. TaxID=175537 RepID=UPI0026228588|nr:hypothetical protein [uncultured Helicobacter sp.]
MVNVLKVICFSLTMECGLFFCPVSSWVITQPKFMLFDALCRIPYVNSVGFFDSTYNAFSTNNASAWDKYAF